MLLLGIPSNPIVMKLILSMFCSFSFIIGICQTSYTSLNYASGNYTLPMTTVTTGLLSQDFDTTGANITWDYSLLGIDVSGSKYTIAPSASGYQAPFITQCVLAGGGFTCLSKWNSLTNIGVVDIDSLDAFVFTLYDVMTMAKKTNNTLVGNVKGLKVKDTNALTIPIVAEYSDPDTILTFPFTYQDSGKSYGEWGLDLTSIGQNIQYKVTYNRKWKAEGWGTLITPYQTHNNVLKVKTTLDQIDSVVFLSTPFGLPRKIVEYTWYDATFGLPVMKAEGIEVLGFTTINTVQYYDTRVVGVTENEIEKLDFTLYPNPATDVLYITPTIETIMTYEILNLAGQAVLPKTTNQSLNVSNLAAGTYFVRATNKANETVYFQKFMKQ